MKGGYRPNSGRKKGSIPWNKGKTSPWAGQNGFKKGQTPWNKGNKKPKIIKPKKSRLGIKVPLEIRLKQSKARVEYFKRTYPNYQQSDNYLSDDRKRVRRERIKVFGGFHSKGEWENLKAKYNWTCPSCKKTEPDIKLTRDHIIAVSMGGSDNIENIQPLCVSCNSRKATQFIKY